MDIIFLGTNGWYDSPTGSTICTLINSERYHILLDAGNGIHKADLGEPRKAIEYYEQQLMITRAIGDRRGEGNALFDTSLALDGLANAAVDSLSFWYCQRIEQQAQAVCSVHCMGNPRGCLTFSKLNDEGLVGACEGDIDSTLTMMMFAYAFGVPGFITDPASATASPARPPASTPTSRSNDCWTRPSCRTISGGSVAVIDRRGDGKGPGFPGHPQRTRPKDRPRSPLQHQLSCPPRVGQVPEETAETLLTRSR